MLTPTSVMTVGFRRNTFEGISVEDLTSVWVWRRIRRFDRLDGVLESQDLI